jgi:hypothetical protein
MEPRAYNRFAIVPIYADSTGVAALRLGSIRRRHQYVGHRSIAADCASIARLEFERKNILTGHGPAVPAPSDELHSTLRPIAEGPPSFDGPR